MMVIKKNKIYVDYYKLNLSKHIQNYKHKKRLSYVGDVASMHFVDAFDVDRGHINGPEIHLITLNGYIVIINARSFKVCTILIARPQQIRRYYQAVKKEVPELLITLAKKNERKNLNEI